MTTHRLCRAITVLLLGVMVWHTGGCLAGDPNMWGQSANALPGAMAKAGDAMVNMVKDQGVLDEFKQNLRGSVQDPSLEAFTRAEWVTGVRLAGVNGDITLVQHGTGTQLPADVRASLIAQLDQPISDEQRNAILEILGWNRIDSPHNPPPDAGG